MPDLDLGTTNGPRRVFTLLHRARPVLLNLGEPGRIDPTPRSDRVQSIDARYDGPWELPAIGPVPAPAAVLIRPDGYVAWVGDETGGPYLLNEYYAHLGFDPDHAAATAERPVPLQEKRSALGLADALTMWFGPPDAA